jgi:hypothetical protein
MEHGVKQLIRIRIVVTATAAAAMEHSLADELGEGIEGKHAESELCLLGQVPHHHCILNGGVQTWGRVKSVSVSVNVCAALHCAVLCCDIKVECSWVGVGQKGLSVAG